LLAGVAALIEEVLLLGGHRASEDRIAMRATAETADDVAVPLRMRGIAASSLPHPTVYRR
jgi:hypothetical protein